MPFKKGNSEYKSSRPDVSRRNSEIKTLEGGEVIVHVMMPNEREFYDLEAFWGHAERIDFQESGKGGG